MDTNAMYAAAMVGRQADYDDFIIKEAWAEDGFESMTTASAQATCSVVHEKQGSEAYSRCMDAANSCGSSKTCDTTAIKYAKALSKGYSKSFDDFKKRSETLAGLGKLGMDLGGAILTILGGNKEGGSDEGGGGSTYCLENPYDALCQPKKSRTGLYIGLGVLAVGAIGAAIYFGRKK